jgi:hypothetical protein
MFQPFSLSTGARASGEVVFAGYGITAPELNYDDYASLDVQDKIVLVMTHEPRVVWPGSARYTHASRRTYKISRQALSIT